MPNGAEPENRKPLSNQLTERLTAERTVALQECLAAKPEAALMAVVHAPAPRAYRQEFRGDTCLGLEANRGAGHVRAERHESRAGQSLARRHEDWSRKLPTESAELWSWVIGQDTETCSVCSRTAQGARSMRCSDRGSATSRLASRRSRAHDRPRHGRVVGADAREAIFAHVSKALILEAVRDGVSEKDADTLAGLEGSDDRARRAPALRKRWLPAVLRNDLNAPLLHRRLNNKPFHLFFPTGRFLLSKEAAPFPAARSDRHFLLSSRFPNGRKSAERELWLSRNPSVKRNSKARRARGLRHRR